jgi:hypothetical protein
MLELGFHSYCSNWLQVIIILICCIALAPGKYSCPEISLLQVNLSRVEQFIQKIGIQEDNIFQKRARLLQVTAEV